MIEQFKQQYQSLKQWADAALQDGWLSNRDLNRFQQIEQQQAETLFAQQGQRPLIVAFFGGTGVGKSSLLNRLAREDIARTGVQRPTSQEVTLYLHKDYQLGKLPDELPVEHTRIAYHQDEKRRLIAWLDMPDFDSVEQSHREQVEAWLPYIDWLVYVVSPERYHDDVGWRLLQQRNAKHHWLFVINHWDRGSDPQLEDFRQRLQKEAFDTPKILRTSCRKNGGDDDFPQLEQTINHAIEAHGLALLQQLGIQVRLNELHTVEQALRQRLEGFGRTEVADAWQNTTAEWLNEIEDALLLNRTAINQTLLAQEQLSQSLFKRQTALPTSLPTTKQVIEQIWSERFNDLISDLTTELKNLLGQHDIPVTPYAEPLSGIPEKLQSTFEAQLEGSMIKVLAKPGTAVQRFFFTITGWLSWFLPLSAAGWAIYHIISRFHAGTQGEGHFLGIDFAVHSGLLILLAWFIPWLAQRKLHPSIAGTLSKGLTEGIHAAVDAWKSEFESLWLEQEASRLSHLDALKNRPSPQ
ncbi:MAG: hypothetical protein DIZ77_02725 [endosymbiont of Seepiophila jonesi]|uniref:G domain-containing protein n=1 Tax=endosymbiont of Lamellibrachia luymesi TaxID=2200907 RepID=A0A370DUQ1_9GAMM|nr:MAG: hypothetical protein DIZ79_13125 [endosymbiont of Lamellibrachia luymesi]RDH94128.1 MAG: hypothetical protein DIZ77_02725 [endosymbiont of Seepiophila jonesi]